MKRKIIKIDEEKCNGCGLCVPECHEGALQIIDDKARLISDLFCDGLGACLGHCPEGAITIEEREAEPYSETKVMEIISKQGSNTITAHLKHLQEHGETAFLSEAIRYIKTHNVNVDIHQFIEEPVKQETVAAHHQHHIPKSEIQFSGCPGSASREFGNPDKEPQSNQIENVQADSELTHWPVQLHLLNPLAPYLPDSDLVMAADCVAFSMGNFHNQFLKGNKLAIACPKLDSNKEVYIEKLTYMIDHAKINTLTVVVMEVPCCSGLLQIAQLASESASRKIPIKKAVIGIKGDIISEDWV